MPISAGAALQNHLCHGDFCDCNIIVAPCLRSLFGYKIALIDFDWSGKAGKTTYPFFMNYSEMKLPQMGCLLVLKMIFSQLSTCSVESEL